jgi:hypothetical protein
VHHFVGYLFMKLDTFLTAETQTRPRLWITNWSFVNPPQDCKALHSWWKPPSAHFLPIHHGRHNVVIFFWGELCANICVRAIIVWIPQPVARGVHRYVHLKSHYRNAKRMYTQISDWRKANNEKYWIRNYHHNKIWFFWRHLNVITAHISAISIYCKEYNVLSINKGSLLVCHVEISQMMVYLLTLLLLLESPLMGKGASRFFHNVKTYDLWCSNYWILSKFFIENSIKSNIKMWRKLGHILVLL